MRPLDEWDQSDLQALIDGQVQEFLQLDYKASDALANTDGKKAELAKDVSAFANSAGGRIVYGITEDKRFPIAIDAGSDPRLISKEWIEQVVMSGISPRVDGVRIKEIALPSGRAVYVVDIPQASSRAPHQSKDKRYYKRYNYQSVPMEDYELKDILRRASSPDLMSWFLLEKVTFNQETDTFLSTLSINIANRSTEPALYATIRVFIDPRLYGGSLFQFEKAEVSFNPLKNGQGVNLNLYIRNITPNHHIPLFKEQPLNIVKIPVDMKRNIPYICAVAIAAPGCTHNRSVILQNGSEIAIIPEISQELELVPPGW